MEILNMKCRNCGEIPDYYIVGDTVVNVETNEIKIEYLFQCSCGKDWKYEFFGKLENIVSCEY